MSNACTSAVRSGRASGMLLRAPDPGPGGKPWPSTPMPSRSGAVTRPFRPQTRNTVRSLLADDVTWHNPGGNHLSGDHRGVDPAIGPFAKFFEDSGGTFKAGVHDILASDTHAVALI